MTKCVMSVMLIAGMSAFFTVTAGGAEMKFTSPAFGNNQAIPERYSCKGEGINPALKIEGVPAGTKSLAMIVDDPDAPMGIWVHWVVYNISPEMKDIFENSIPGMQGINSGRQYGYMGPCPPSGTHRHFFKLYALDTMLVFDADSADKTAVEKAIKGHIIGSAELMGTFSYSP
jgi:Raf kinase inhibitor-like YbhB/YbcL family protein